MKAHIIAGLGFGDEGKGTIVDAIVRKTKAQWVIRYNGGAQAAHNVVTDEGFHHTFSQFGSGTLAGASTYLSRFMMVEPLAMRTEAEALEKILGDDPLRNMVIDVEAPILTYYHRQLNRLREISRGNSKHGSCGMGISELAMDMRDYPELIIKAGNLGQRGLVKNKLEKIFDLKIEQARSLELPQKTLVGEYLTDTLITPDFLATSLQDFWASRVRIDGPPFISPGDLVFEGAQGVLLDEWVGFHPYTTWSTTTFANAEILLDELNFQGEETRIGVTRAYGTRHGAGPFPTEDLNLKQKVLRHEKNTHDSWQGDFRVGHLDLVLLNYAIEVSGDVDVLAVTHLDEIPEIWQMCRSYDGNNLGSLANEFVDNRSFMEIKAPPPGSQDLERQERLTEALKMVAPASWITGGTAKTFTHCLKDYTDLPIAIESYGPTPAQKKFLKAIKNV